MGCFHPNSAYQSIKLKDNGRSDIKFKTPSDSHLYTAIKLPCGQCIGCRLDYSRQWAVRCYHESKQHEQNSFITLTYDNENLPEFESVQLRDYQLFMKVLRKNIKKTSDKLIKYYHCGEYGEKLGRPHYHAILFGHDFDDKYLWEINKKTGQKYYRSPTLEKLWPHGNSLIGDVTFQSAAYVARYIMKKINGEAGDLHYMSFDTSTGEVIRLQNKEYTSMSNGIGENWILEYADESFEFDSVIINEREVKMPRYYDNKYEILNPEKFAKVKQQRKTKIKKVTLQQLAAGETILKQKLNQLKRPYHEN